mgnify:CR=1 FL=1
MLRISIILTIILLSQAPWIHAQESADEESMLLTVILRHDQSMTLDEISEHLRKTSFWENFPPNGVDVVSWNIAMGVGHIITLRLPPSRLREVNLAVEKRAWGAFRTEFYPTYDYKTIWTSSRKASSQAARVN